MNQEDLIYLDNAAQTAYMAFTRRFESEDWKTMVEWAEERASAAGLRQLNATTWDQANIARGSRQAFQEIVNLENDVENQFITLVAQAKEAQIAEDETEHE